ncbi:RnfABCDGE type electron transport complex subunit D [Kovacikia minuta CCNUW1]|uniref:RnfABCDGE type electron transport complex subunit D n=1 Tax=Kovacikia minuta TaxID=2931930 RepID=UPI001CC9E8BB|nr:RnfABCDGE type electron transport complex subunit D [Kovacikia minuta]UBF26380.1 RnfABCDGE type electron transport complex subunit D [Kovacikia minuta CCNUW1]
MLPTDARLYQILFLALFLVVGIGTRDWTLHPGMIGMAIATCLLTQIVALWVVAGIDKAEGRGQRTEGEGDGEDGGENPFPTPYSPLPTPHFKTQNFYPLSFILHPSSFIPPVSSLLSPLITSLGLSLLLRADHYSTIALACACAILSKFLLRVRDKHIFNPGNFGIIAALLLTPDAWVSPGQWGEEGWYGLLFLGAGGLVVQKVGRWDTTLAFLGTYAGLEAVRNLWLGWTWDVWAHRLMSGSLLLFAFFMITDPRTIPNARVARVLWAGTIALLTFILRNVYFIPTAVFWALFTLAPLSILLDLVFPDSRFSWMGSQEDGGKAEGRGQRAEGEQVSGVRC